MRAAVAAVAAVTALLPLLPACRATPPPLHTCADRVGGVWHATDDEGYHILDFGRTVELYPMWDASRPPDGAKALLLTDPTAPPDATPIYSPPRIELVRDGETVSGTSTFRLTRRGVTCKVVQPARLTDCADHRLVFAVKKVTAVDQATCLAAVSSIWTDVPLQRR